MSKDDPNDVKVEEIPLPPPEMWGELDNSGEVPRPQQPSSAAAPSNNRPIARLAFRHGETSRTIPLQFPFDHPDLGAVDAITVRRLTVGEVGDIITNRPRNPPDLFDIYEVMCGLPADVLRGLMDVDGEAVTEICFDFLPLLFRPARAGSSGSSSTSETGGA